MAMKRVRGRDEPGYKAWDRSLGLGQRRYPTKASDWPNVGPPPTSSPSVVERAKRVASSVKERIVGGEGYKRPGAAQADALAKDLAGREAQRAKDRARAATEKWDISVRVPKRKK